MITDHPFCPGANNERCQFNPYGHPSGVCDHTVEEHTPHTPAGIAMALEDNLFSMIPSIPDTVAENRAKRVLAQQNLETMLSAAEHCVEAGAPNAAITHLIQYLKAIAPHTFTIKAEGNFSISLPNTECEICGVIRQLHG